MTTASYHPNLRVKNRYASTVLGPWFVDTTDAADVTQLELRTYVDGTPQQKGNTRDLVTGIAALVEYLSSSMTLAPGDIILMGTPEDVVDVNAGTKSSARPMAWPSCERDRFQRGLTPRLTF